VIDGCIDPWYAMPALKLNDLLKTHTEFADSSLSSTTFALVMNKASYDRLPRDLKDVIDASSGLAAAGAAGTMWDLQARAVADSVAQRGDPITTLLPESVAHWRKATEPVINAWLKAMKEQKADGGKLLASAHALLTKYVNEPEPQPARAAPTEEVSEPSPSAQQTPQSQAPSSTQANADTRTTPKGDVPSAAPAQPAAPAQAAKPVTTASATPSAPDQPQTSWWRWLFGSKSTPAVVQPTPVATHAPPPAGPAPAAHVSTPPASAPPAAAPPPTASTSAANSAAAASPAAPIATPPAVTPAPASAPVMTPAPIPAPVTPIVKPAAKALDIPL
jgi:hypothetical protein